MKTALISVSNKEKIIPLAEELIRSGYRIISTGGTARFLAENGIKTVPVENVTGFPEILGGRVKTLHPKILGAILADLSGKDHIEELEKMMIDHIETVVVNLYPFEQVLKKADTDHKEKIENIDIGGVTLLRAAAKNYRHVTILSEIGDYEWYTGLLANNRRITEVQRLNLAVKAFQKTSEYDTIIASYLNSINKELNSDFLIPAVRQQQQLRYGENPHQEGYYLSLASERPVELLHGKLLSYNNYLDIDAALRTISKFSEPTVAIFKHTNPCGAASDSNPTDAYLKAFNTDTQSPFGGIVISNRCLRLETAKAMNKVFTEIIIAPDFQQQALEFLKKKKLRRLIRYSPEKTGQYKESVRYISCLNGLLAQRLDTGYDCEQEWEIVTKRKISPEQMNDLRFAWKIVAVLKSNAICLAANERTIGLGMGQTSRVDSMQHAIIRADKFGHSLTGAVCASDGFFPFRDSIDLLAEKGVTAIIQPGGSKGDKEVISACDEHNIAMIFTGMRHFAH